METFPEACKPLNSAPGRFSQPQSSANARPATTSLHMRLSGPSSGSARRRARERRQAQLTRAEGERLARERREQRARDKSAQQRQVRVCRRPSGPSSGSARRRARERRQAQLTRAEGERLARERREERARDKSAQQRQVRVCRRPSGPSSGSARRRARERRQAQLTRAEGEWLAREPQIRERREQRARDKSAQQRQARVELAAYEPWGRAGGGAPNPRSLRRTDLRTKGIYPEDELKGVSAHEACRRWSGRRRRRRTPVRLREDPQLCFADNLRQTIDNDVRYRQTPDQHNSYRQILDDMVDMRKKAIKDEMKRNLEYERKMQTMDGPWGKPGPGGTSWRNPRNIGFNFSNSMGWTDNDIFTKLRLEHKRYKRSSLTLPNVKRDDDSKEKGTPDKENVKSLKLPDIKQTNSPKSKPQEEPKESCSKTSNCKDVKEDDSVATVKENSKPKKKKFVKRLSNGEKIKRVVPEDDDDGDDKKGSGNMMNGNQLTPEERILHMTGGVELVPLLARRRRVGARTLPSSDITRPPDQFCQWREMLNDDYLRELKHQMTVKCQKKEETRLNSAESVRQHHATWESLWGRPGHGAPQRGRYARSNLARLLYVTPLVNK